MARFPQAKLGVRLGHFPRARVFQDLYHPEYGHVIGLAVALVRVLERAPLQHKSR